MGTLSGPPEPRRALMIAMVPVVISLAMLVAAVAPRVFPVPDVFLWLSDEDHPIEWLQFALLVPATGAFGLAALRLRRIGRNFTAMLSAAVTFGLFFIAGEEISWGQRAFGWETPGSFGDRNWQNETTFHNFTGVHAYFVYGVATIGLYAALAPLLWNAVWSRRRRSPLAYLLVPPAFLVFSFVPAFVYRTIRLAFQPEAHYPSLIGGIVEYAETTELCLYFGFCVFGLLHLRVVNGACRHHPGRRG